MALLFLIFSALSFVTPLIGAIISLLLMVKYKDFTRKYVFGLIFAVSIGMLFYHFYPSGDQDAARYFLYMNDLTAIGPSAALTEIFTKEDVLSYLLMYATSSVVGNHYIVLVVSLICYSVYFFILTRVGKEQQLSPAKMNLALIIFIASFNVVATLVGARFGIATALFVLAVFLEDRGKKRLAILFYVLAILSHTSAILLLAIRFASRLLKGRLKRLAIPILLIAPTALIPIVFLVLGSVDSFAESDTLFKLGFYVNPDGLPSAYIFWFNLAYSVLALALLVIYKKKNPNSGGKMVDVSIALLALGIGSVMYPVIAGRLMTAGRYMFLMNIPLILYMFYPEVKAKFYPMWSRFGKHTLILFASVAVVFQIYAFTFLDIDWRGGLINNSQLDNSKVITEKGERP